MCLVGRYIIFYFSTLKLLKTFKNINLKKY